MIAHNVSVVVVQSVAAQGVLDHQPARAREPLAHIERSGRQALTELRTFLEGAEIDVEVLTPAPRNGGRRRTAKKPA